MKGLFNCVLALTKLDFVLKYCDIYGRLITHQYSLVKKSYLRYKLVPLIVSYIAPNTKNHFNVLELPF